MWQHSRMLQQVNQQPGRAL